MFATTANEGIFDFGEVAEVIHIPCPTSKVQGRLFFGPWTLDFGLGTCRPFVNQPQPFQSQRLIDRFDEFRSLCDQRRQATSSNYARRTTKLINHLSQNTIDQTN